MSCGTNLYDFMGEHWIVTIILLAMFCNFVLAALSILKRKRL